MSGIGKPLPTHLLTYSLTHLLTTMRDREILIGVTGGIAAYKTAALVSQLVQGGAKVTVVMTEAAQRFVGPATFAALTGRRPLGVVPHLGDARDDDDRVADALRDALSLGGVRLLLGERRAS